MKDIIIEQLAKERKRITFLLDDIIRAMFIAELSSRKTCEM